MIPAKPLSQPERIAILLEAAKLARDNARICRQMARAWPVERREWFELDMIKSHKAWRRAYSYLGQARQLRG